MLGSSRSDTANHRLITQMNKTQAEAAPMNGVQATTGVFRFSMPQFLVALILLLVLYPFIVEIEHGQIIEDVATMIILISAVLAVGGRSWVLTIVLVIPALAGPWMDHYWRGGVPSWIINGAHMIFV